MLSKEEKLRYGEILRQQMKDKQDRKRQDDAMKRGQPTVPKVYSDRILLPDPSINVDPKLVLQNKLETQDYNPFGRAGGGAPNIKGHNVTAENNHSGMVMGNQQTYQQRQMQQPIYSGENYLPISSQKYQNSYQPPKNDSIRMAEQQQYQRPIEYPPPPQPKPQYQQYPQYIEPPKIPMQYQQQQMRGYPQPVRYVEPPMYPQPPMIETRVVQGERMRTLENEQMQEMYRRGGRNLLKLQNETANEHLVKQKQKLQMQAFLKQQMEEVEYRKQLEKDKVKREQMQEEKRNREYIDQQNQKLRDEERKKNEEKQKIVEDNLKNLARRKELEQEAKDKLERERLNHLQNQRRREHQDRQRQRDRSRVQNDKAAGKISKMSREQPTDSLSSTSSENTTTQGKGFNTDISREFFRKEREKEPEKFRNDKKLEMFTSQIQKMRDEINNQGEMFQKEIEKIKRQAEHAHIQKQKAEFQIQKLKLELERKNKQAEFKLLEALKRNDPYGQSQRQEYPQRQMEYPLKRQEYDSLSEFQHPDMYRPPKQAPYVPPTPPKMPKTNKVQQYYEQPQPLQQRQPQRAPQKQSKKNLVDYEYDSRLDESEMMTLQGDSKKIPLSLTGNTKLTMSKIQNYGKDSSYYQQSRPMVKNYHKPEAIVQEMEQSRVKSRKSQRGMDQLDRLVGSRQNKRWEMSTVNDDITKEIEELLKKKDSSSKPSGYNKIGQAGRQVVSRGGLPYEGNINTMSSNRISAVSNGTIDIEKVHDRNEARLRELKALGVETVNTNNDDDLNRLNDLLKNYQ